MRPERKNCYSSDMSCANELAMRAYNQTYLESQSPIASTNHAESGTTWTELWIDWVSFLW